ncbi:oligosaccharide flippase family protein [Loigolactobacillus binensis]|uniref:Polysaccharide biosynthesis C-terminal domain-containing protein n=1 Tax=Loigolactobacillus binensis TaxID=2559922 RepID=A0ABW3EFC9_9LACO|nr:polysaccharide biosynthesis C-terminal domain-containing protein [Loigolactobacillus binensis]
MKVVRNYFYNIFYQVLLLIAPLITVPYVARVIGPTGVGINAYTNSIVTYFVLAGSLGITLYGNREIAFHRDSLADRSRIFWEIELLQVSTILLAYVAFTIFLSFMPHYRLFFLMQSFSLIAGAFDISWYFMGLEDFKKTVLKNAFVRILTIILIFLLVHKPSDLWLYIAIISASSIAGNVVLWPYLRQSVQKVALNKLHIWRHIGPAFVLFIPTVSMQLYIMVNKTMLKSMVSVGAAGFMDYSDKLINMSMVVVTSLSTVLLPHVANLFARDKMEAVRQSLYRSFQFITALAVPIAFGMAAIAPKFIVWFLTPRFAPTGLLLSIQTPILVLIAWNNTIGRQYLLPVKRTWDYTVSVSLGAFVNIIANYVCIKALGVYGAAVATVLTEVFVTGYQIIAVRRDLDLRQMFHDLWKFCIAGLLMGGAVWLLSSSLPNALIYFFLEVCAGVLVYVLLLIVLKADIFVEVLGYARKWLAKR